MKLRNQLLLLTLELISLFTILMVLFYTKLICTRTRHLDLMVITLVIKAGYTGNHQLCFINKNSYADKTVAFSFVGPDDLAKIQAPKDASG